jgi:hypothetical protein
MPRYSQHPENSSATMTGMKTFLISIQSLHSLSSAGFQSDLKTPAALPDLSLSPGGADDVLEIWANAAGLPNLRFVFGRSYGLAPPGLLDDPDSGLTGFVGPDGFIGLLLLMLPTPPEPGSVAEPAGGALGAPVKPRAASELPREGAVVPVEGAVLGEVGEAAPGFAFSPIPIDPLPVPAEPSVPCA